MLSLVVQHQDGNSCSALAPAGISTISAHGTPLLREWLCNVTAPEKQLASPPQPRYTVAGAGLTTESAQTNRQLSELHLPITGPTLSDIGVHQSGDDGQGQCGALELRQLVARHTVLRLPGQGCDVEGRIPLREQLHHMGPAQDHHSVELETMVFNAVSLHKKVSAIFQ
ncbi:hypothetical protein MC885_018309 [Smutsia gigantea]|nr:hypothetical protein MC885_018309 [Smutsia gigantea]